MTLTSSSVNEEPVSEELELAVDAVVAATNFSSRDERGAAFILLAVSGVPSSWRTASLAAVAAVMVQKGLAAGGVGSVGC